MANLILWILIPIALIVAVLLGVILYTASIKRRKDKVLKDLGIAIKKERMTKVGTILSRVKRISKDNKKYEKLFNDLDSLHTEMDERVNKLLDQYGILTLNAKRMRLNQFNAHAEQIDALVSGLNNMQHRFETSAERITQQDDFMTSEFSFYTRNLRKVIAVYRQKRILLDRIAPKLDNLSLELKTLEKQFNVHLDSADVRGAAKTLEKYSKRVVLFSEIINEGPSIQAYLYITIPQIVKSLVKNYNAKKAEVSGTLEHIDFKNSIEEIGKRFRVAKGQYNSLKLGPAKDSIRNIIKSLKIIERLINQEIKSRNVFLQNYETVIDEAKSTLRNFVTIQKQIKDLSGRGIAIPVELSETYSKILIDAKQLDLNAVKFRTTAKSNTIPFSAKLARMKLLLREISEFTGLLNDATTSVWALNVEKLITKNKFRRSEAALNEVVASTKTEKIILTKEEQENFEIISNQLSALAPMISKDMSSKEITAKVDDLVEKTIGYYQVVGGKIQIVQIVKNLIKELSPKRALDLELNTQLTIAESSFLKGEYDAALSNIITHLEETEN